MPSPDDDDHDDDDEEEEEEDFDGDRFGMMMDDVDGDDRPKRGRHRHQATASGILEINELHFEFGGLPAAAPNLELVRSSSLDTGLRRNELENGDLEPMALSILNSVDVVVSTDDESFDDIAVYLEDSNTSKWKRPKRRGHHDGADSIDYGDPTGGRSKSPRPRIKMFAPKILTKTDRRRSATVQSPTSPRSPSTRRRRGHSFSINPMHSDLSTDSVDC